MKLSSIYLWNKSQKARLVLTIIDNAVNWKRLSNELQRLYFHIDKMIYSLCRALSTPKVHCGKIALDFQMLDRNIKICDLNQKYLKIVTKIDVDVKRFSYVVFSFVAELRSQSCMNVILRPHKPVITMSHRNRSFRERLLWGCPQTTSAL